MPSVSTKIPSDGSAADHIRMLDTATGDPQRFSKLPVSQPGVRSQLRSRRNAGQFLSSIRLSSQDARKQGRNAGYLLRGHDCSFQSSLNWNLAAKSTGTLLLPASAERPVKLHKTLVLGATRL